MTRTKILDAALEQFAQRGYSDVSLKQIAQRVGIAAPSIYAHFASKEALYAAVYERSARAHERFFRQRLAAIAELSPAEHLRSVLTSVPEFYRRHPDHYGFHFAAATEPESRLAGTKAAFDWLEQQLRAAAESAYAAGVATGEFRAVPVDDFLALFLCLLDGIYLEMTHYPEPLYSRRLEQVWATLHALIRADPA